MSTTTSTEFDRGYADQMAWLREPDGVLFEQVGGPSAAAFLLGGLW